MTESDSFGLMVGIVGMLLSAVVIVALTAGVPIPLWLGLMPIYGQFVVATLKAALS